MDLNDSATLLGLVAAVTGLTLSILNYLRDRIRLNVTLRWDMAVTPNSVYDSNKKYGLVKITNAGRRTTYVGAVLLMFPRGADDRVLLLKDGAAGDKLEEGSPPRIIMVDQTGFERYADHWDKIVAEVTDSTGKKWRSKPADKAFGVPSWAKEQRSSPSIKGDNDQS